MLADDVDCIAGLRAMAESTMTDLITATTPPIPTVNWSHVEGGLITRIQVTFDPRPLFEK